MSKNQEFFEEKFNLTYPEFTKSILFKHPSLTSLELKLCAYLKFNLNSNEICELTNQKIRTIEKRSSIKIKYMLVLLSGLLKSTDIKVSVDISIK